MKLSFSKNDDLEVSVKQKIGDVYYPFSYIEMIRGLIDTKKLCEPEIIGDFSESERNSIASMIKHINDEVSDFYTQEDVEGGDVSYSDTSN